MKVACPSCQTSIQIAGTEPVLACPACDLAAPISQLATSPGIGPLAALRDFVGETVGEYEIDALVGVGGMGKVYRASERGAPGSVAVKILHSDFRHNREEFVERFEREANALHRLVHPHIVRILDHGEQDGTHYLVTELVDGKDLAVRMREEQLTLEDAVGIMVQVCDGMAYAHQAGVVHRDLKPANIIIASDGTVKVLDFGLAQITGADAQITSLTRTDLAIGTFNYLSPEQRMNAKAVDARADIFSLGVVFFEMLTGTLPIGSFALPSELGRGVSRKCDQVVKRALSPSPEARYQHVEDFAAALRALAPRQSRTGGKRAAVAVALAGVLGGAGWLAAGTLNTSNSEVVAPATEEPAPALLTTTPPFDAGASELSVAAATEPPDAAPLAAAVTPPDAAARPARGTPGPPARGGKKPRKKPGRRPDRPAP